jgi:hypothetical protein
MESVTFYLTESKLDGTLEHDPHFYNWLTAWHVQEGCEEGEPDVPPANVWIGATVEDQRRADERIPALLSIPAQVRFLSCEPLLESVSLAGWFHGQSNRSVRNDGDQEGFCGLHWVICGGESGKGSGAKAARPMHPDWARGLRDQCAAAGVPFFFKQWGEWRPMDDSEDFAPVPGLPDDWRDLPERYRCMRSDGKLTSGYDGSSAEFVFRVGKAAAGRLLDGVTHDGFPSSIPTSALPLPTSST